LTGDICQQLYARRDAYRESIVTSRRSSRLAKSIFAYRPRQPLPLEEPAPEPRPGAPAPQPEIEDETELIARARTDPAAFGRLYEHYVDRIYSYVFHRVGNVQDAEDLTARTFYRGLDKLDTYEDRGLPFSAWLFRIAHNLVANWHRDHGRQQVLTLDQVDFRAQDDDRPEDAVEAQVAQEELWAAINRLPEERRRLLLYKFGDALSNLEIGALMNKSEGAIKSLYFRTLAALRQDLEARGWGGGDRHESTGAVVNAGIDPHSEGRGARDDDAAT
jgi:RNA polymerase sigma-70 factor (ECF subfamily)